ncbi:MAG TPA: hypothetical protein VGN22_00710 [Pseudonocardia sp.]|jgi:hypothetical protein
MARDEFGVAEGGRRVRDNASPPGSEAFCSAVWAAWTVAPPDWPGIAALYTQLLALSPGPVVTSPGSVAHGADVLGRSPGWLNGALCDVFAQVVPNQVNASSRMSVRRKSTS